MSDTKLTITLDLDRRGATRQAQGFRAEQHKLAQDLLADELAAERAREELARKESRARVQAAGQTRDAMGKFTRQAADDATASFTQIGKAGKGAFAGIGKAVGSFGAQMLGLNSAQAVLGAIIDNFELARQNAYKASEMVNDYRESLKELAALKGKLGNTSEVLKEDIAFRAETLQTREEASAFQKSALGVGESAVGTNISRAEWEKALVQAGKFQAAEGESAETHGTLVGTIATLAKKQITGQELFDKEQQLFYISQPGGFGFASGMQQFAKLAPLVKSGVYQDTEMMALLSAFSTSNKEGAGENVQQFTRATIGGIGKMAGVRIEGAEKVGQYLKSLGVTDDFLKKTAATSQPFAIGDKISADLDRAKAEAADKGEEFNPYVYLKHKGYGNQEDAAALMQYYGLKQTGALEKTFMPRAQPGALPDARKAMEEFEARKTKEMEFEKRRSAFGVEAANIALGAGKEERLNSLKEAAFARVRARNETSYDNYKAVHDLYKFGPTNVLFHDRDKVDMEAQRMLVDEANRRGVKHGLDKYLNQYTPTGPKSRVDYYAGDDALYDLASKLSAAGGDPLAGLGDVHRKAIDSVSAGQQYGQAPAPAAAPRDGGGDAGLFGQMVKLLGTIAGNTAGKAPAPRPLVGPPPARTR